jgi:hypothetical protein
MQFSLEINYFAEVQLKKLGLPVPEPVVGDLEPILTSMSKEELAIWSESRFRKIEAMLPYLEQSQRRAFKEFVETCKSLDGQLPSYVNSDVTMITPGAEIRRWIKCFYPDLWPVTLPYSKELEDRKSDFVKALGKNTPYVVDGRWMLAGSKSIYTLDATSRIEADEELACYRAQINVAAPKPKAPKAPPKYLYHGTLLANVDSIEEQGLQPRVGHFSASFHGEKCKPVVIAADAKHLDTLVSALVFHVGDIAEGAPLTDQFVINNTAICVLAGNSFRQAAGYEDEPPQVEGGDWFSLDTVQPVDVLTGERLARFLAKQGCWPSDINDFVLADEKLDESDEIEDDVGRNFGR